MPKVTSTPQDRIARLEAKLAAAKAKMSGTETDDVAHALRFRSPKKASPSDAAIRASVEIATRRKFSLEDTMSSFDTISIDREQLSTSDNETRIQTGMNKVMLTLRKTWPFVDFFVGSPPTDDAPWVVLWRAKTWPSVDETVNILRNLESSIKMTPKTPKVPRAKKAKKADASASEASGSEASSEHGSEHGSEHDSAKAADPDATESEHEDN